MSTQDTIKQALEAAFHMGQDYWRQADSESWKENKRASGTANKFRELVNETLAAPSAAPVQPASKPEFKHTDDVAVDRFAIAMKDKLAKARAKGRSGWDNEALCTVEYLSELLREHVEKGDPVDVANFCMMLQQRGSRIVGSTKSSDAQPAPSAALTDEEIRIIYAAEIGISAKSDDVAFARAVLAAALTRCATSNKENNDDA